MSTDYFAHAVYGIAVPPEQNRELLEFITNLTNHDWELLYTAVEKIDQRGGNALAWGDNETVQGFLNLAARDDLGHIEIIGNWQELVNKIAVSMKLDAGKYGLITTGDEDDRPGRCWMATDQFIFGYGLFSVDPTRMDVAAWRQLAALGAEWHTWVTAG